jgi:CO/xanthine dehydrogenase FAD-binding subunit
MIPFDFEYYRPDTMREASELFHTLDSEGKTPVYYGGGSELISMARVGLGSAVTLSDIAESNYFPLLSKTVGRIADHTMQCKITLGGNLASTIIYREAVLPLLLTDARVTAAGIDGEKEYDIHQIFKERLLLPKDEFLIKVTIGTQYLPLPFFHVKKTKNEKIDYPLITAEGLKKDGMIRAAFSGLASFPFRDIGVEAILNDAALSFEQRADQIVLALSDSIQNNLSGSAEYRKYVLKDTMINALEAMKDK